MAHLSIRLLGGFEVKKDGEPITDLGTDKARGLLAYLAVEAARPQRRETLVGLFWPQHGEQRARANLSQALYMLRCALGRDDAGRWLECADRETVQFNRESDYWLDTAALVDALRSARKSQAGDGALSHLTEAAALYTGPFLAGFSLADSPAFEFWSLLQREQLHGLMLTILERLVACHETRAAYEPALSYAWRLAELDPWREEVQQSVMRLLALSGRRCEALAHYVAWRRRLAQELGVAPLATTTQLYQEIRQAFPSASPELD